MKKAEYYVEQFTFNGKPDNNFSGSKQPAEHEDGAAVWIWWLARTLQQLCNLLLKEDEKDCRERAKSGWRGQFNTVCHSTARGVMVSIGWAPANRLLNVNSGRLQWRHRVFQDMPPWSRTSRPVRGRPGGPSTSPRASHLKSLWTGCFLKTLNMQ